MDRGVLVFTSTSDPSRVLEPSGDADGTTEISRIPQILQLSRPIHHLWLRAAFRGSYKSFSGPASASFSRSRIWLSNLGEFNPAAGRGTRNIFSCTRVPIIAFCPRDMGIRRPRLVETASKTLEERYRRWLHTWRYSEIDSLWKLSFSTCPTI